MLKAPGGHLKAPRVTYQPCLEAEEPVLCDGAAELGKLSHWARKCLGPGYNLSHRLDTGEPSLKPPPEMLRASVGWLQLPPLLPCHQPESVYEGAPRSQTPSPVPNP